MNGRSNLTETYAIIRDSVDDEMHIEFNSESKQIFIKARDTTDGREIELEFNATKAQKLIDFLTLYIDECEENGYV